MPESLARGLPGLRRLDHVGLTVPDLDQAQAFFCEVIGCELLYEMGALRRDDAWMAEHLNLPAGSALRGLKFLRCADGTQIELLAFEACDPRPVPRNTDGGGHHLAFYVDDIDQATAHLRAHGVRVQGAPKASASGPSAGQHWVYFLTPWDLQCELVSYPHGKAFDRQQTTGDLHDDIH